MKTTRPQHDEGALETENELVERLLLTVPEAARALAIGRTMLYELIAERRIEIVHIGRCTGVPVDALRTFLDAERARR